MGDSEVDTMKAAREGRAGLDLSTDLKVPLPRTKGVLIPLKTTLETRAREKIGKVYVTGTPAKLASGVLNLVRKLVPDDGGFDFQHLRRFAKLKDLPPHVVELLSSPATPSSAELFLIMGLTSAVSFTELLLALTSILGDVYIVEVDVPMLAPTSQKQATAWTERFWPTVYKKSNPFGPHPSIVERAQEEMRGGGEVERYMELAERVAEEGFESGGGGGERVGVVLVERKGGRGRIVAVAGDARWVSWGERKGSGNVVAHAVMRAIGMVAGGLKTREEVGAVNPGRKDVNPTKGNDAEAESNGSTGIMSETGVDSVDRHVESIPEQPKPFTTLGQPASPPKKDSATEPLSSEIPDIFKDEPLLEIEKEYYDPSGNENGYLCHELEIYCTHEPCVMCSMAIVHSRFGRVVFKRRMAETGGLCADGELGHGLFWRKELNWTLLGWQWVCDGGGEEEENLFFHA